MPAIDQIYFTMDEKRKVTNLYVLPPPSAEDVLQVTRCPVSHSSLLLIIFGTCHPDDYDLMTAVYIPMFQTHLL